MFEPKKSGPDGTQRITIAFVENRLVLGGGSEQVVCDVIRWSGSQSLSSRLDLPSRNG